MTVRKVNAAFIRWLQEDRWFTDDRQRAENGRIIWEECGHQLWKTSILGVLNGMLGWLGLTLYVRVDLESGAMTGAGFWRLK